MLNLYGLLIIISFLVKINKINLKRKCKIGKARNIRMCYNIVDIDNRLSGRRNISDRSKSMGGLK